MAYNINASSHLSKPIKIVTELNYSIRWSGQFPERLNTGSNVLASPVT
jgi:hypothetical protein